MTTPTLAEIAKAKKAPAPPAATHTPEPVPIAETSTAPTATVVVTDVFDGPTNAVAVIGGAAASALAVIENADTSTEFPFPIIRLSGGPTGGLFDVAEGTPEDIMVRLPQGRSPILGIFLGFRSEVAAWPSGFNQRDPEAELRPSWSCAVSSLDGANSQRLEAAAKQYQFTPGANKAKFDFATSGVGHLRPQLSVMLWLPQIQDIVVVQATAGYDSWVESMRGLGRLIDPATGGIGRQPVTIRAKTEDRSSKKSGHAWKSHLLTFETTATDSGVQAYQAFDAWRQGVPAERKQQVAEWIACADRPITEVAATALARGATL